MTEAICQNCGAIFVLDKKLPEKMQCNCEGKEFKVEVKVAS